MTPTTEMIEAGWKAGLGLNKLQVERIVVAALASVPANGRHSVVAAFEEAYPELYYHIAKRKICAGEPLYGAIITTVGTTEIGHGESDISADDALRIAIENAGLTVPALDTTEGSKG